MCQVYRDNAKNLIAHIDVPLAYTESERQHFYIVEGYRRLRKSWDRDARFILEHSGTTQQVLIDRFPASKRLGGTFRVLK